MRLGRKFRRRLSLRRLGLGHVGLAWLGLAAVVASPAPAGAAGSGDLDVHGVDSRNHPVVTLTVEPPQQLAEADLDASAFTLVENGRRLPVEVARMTGDEVAAAGLEVVLVVDTSGSMKGAPMAAAKQAASSFAGRMPEDTRIAVVAFGDRPYVVARMGTDRKAVTTALAGLSTSGETALYDALHEGLAQFSPEQQNPSGSRSGKTTVRRALVVLSDGGDTASTATLDSTMSALSGARAEFAAVELVTPEYDGSAIRSLAGATEEGGLVLSAGDPARLESLYGDVATGLLSRYAVTYTTRAGGATKVSLAVRWEDVSAETTRVVNLPVLDGAHLSVGASDSTVHSGPGWLGSGAALATGLVISFAALAFVAAWVALREREAKVRLSGRFGLRGALRTETVTEWANRASEAAQRRLERAGRDSTLYDALERAGMALRPGEFVVLGVLVTFVAFALGAVSAGPVVGMVLAVLAGAAFPVVLRHKGKKRCQAFSDQLADTLQLLTGSLRAGHSITQAMDTVAQDAPSPTKEEFQRLVVEVRLGRDLADALRAMHDRVGNQDFEWFVQALQIHREVGGDFAQILDTVAGTIRERTRLRRHVRTLSAEGRLSAVILFVLPFMVGLVVSVMTPGYLGELFHGVGLALLGSAMVFMTGGYFWLRKMVRIEL